MANSTYNDRLTAIREAYEAEKAGMLKSIQKIKSDAANRIKEIAESIKRMESLGQEAIRAQKEVISSARAYGKRERDAYESQIAAAHAHASRYIQEVKDRDRLGSRKAVYQDGIDSIKSLLEELKETMESAHGFGTTFEKICAAASVPDIRSRETDQLFDEAIESVKTAVAAINDSQDGAESDINSVRMIYTALKTCEAILKEGTSALMRSETVRDQLSSDNREIADIKEWEAKEVSALQEKIALSKQEEDCIIAKAEGEISAIPSRVSAKKPSYEEKRSQEAARCEEAVSKIHVDEFETYECYPDAMKLRNDLLEEIANKTSLCLGNVSFGDPSKPLRLLLGRLLSRDERNLAFAKEMLDVDISPIASDPLYFGGNDALYDSVVVDLPKEIMESPDKIVDFYKRLALQFVSRAPKGHAKLRLIDCRPNFSSITSPISALRVWLEDHFGGEKRQDEKAAGFTFDFTETDASQEFSAELDRALADIKSRRPGGSHKDLYLYIVHGYPNFDGSRYGNDLDKKLKQVLMEAKSRGYYFFVSQYTPDDGVYTQDERNPLSPLNAAETHSIHITDIDDGKKTMLWDNKPASFDVTVPEYSHHAFAMALRDALLAKEAVEPIWLDVLLKEEKARRDDPSWKSSSDGRYDISIPYGKDEKGKVAYFRIKDAANPASCLIVGASGSGKSSFIDDFVLAGSYLYGPDELEFYLTDFKSGQSAALASYMKGVPHSKYTPNVRLISLSNTPDDAASMIERVLAIKDARALQFAKLADCGESVATDIDVYNGSQAVRSGSLPRMPWVFFVIDEYNAMVRKVEGGGENIVGKFEEALQTIRTSGIAILFAGQELNSIFKRVFAQTPHRFALANSENAVKAVLEMDGEFTAPGEYVIEGKSYRSIYRNKEMTTGFVPTKVQFAYTGDPKGDKSRQHLQNLLDLLRTRPDWSDDAELFVSGQTGRSRLRDDLNAIHREIAESKDPSGVIPMYLGISSSTGSRVKLTLSPNYLDQSYLQIRAKTTDCTELEKGLIESFLYATSIKGNETAGSVTYLMPVNDINDRSVSPFGKLMSKPGLEGLKKAISTVKDFREIGEAVISLAEEIAHRDKIFAAWRKEDDPDKRASLIKELSPRLLVFHNADLIDIIAQELDLAEDAEEEPAKEEPAPESTGEWEYNTDELGSYYQRLFKKPLPGDISPLDAAKAIYNVLASQIPNFTFEDLNNMPGMMHRVAGAAPAIKPRIEAPKPKLSSAAFLNALKALGQRRAKDRNIYVVLASERSISVSGLDLKGAVGIYPSRKVASGKNVEASDMISPNGAIFYVATGPQTGAKINLYDFPDAIDEGYLSYLSAEER